MNNNKSVLTTIFGIIIIAGIGYLIFKGGNKVPAQPVSTTTPSTTVTSTTPAPVPGLPTVKTGQNVVVSNSTAAVTGEVNPNGAGTTYWYDYGRTTSLGSRTSVQAIGSGYSTIAVPGYITGLRADTLYYFQLNATNRFGTTHGVMYSFTTNSTPPPQGSAPTTHTTGASDISRTSANLHGQINPNGSQTTYWFEYGQDNSFGNVTDLQAAGNGTTTTSVAISLSNLRPLTKYYYRLNAQNQYGTINGAIMSFTTKGPQAPGEPSATTLQQTNVTDASATFNGRVNPNGADTTYWFEYSTDSLLGSVFVSSTPVRSIDAGTASVAVLTDVSGLDANTKYYYRLVARNQYGTVMGDIVSFRTKQ